MRGNKVLVLELREKIIKACCLQVWRRGKVIEALAAEEFPEGVTPKDIESVFLKFTNKVKYEKIVISLSRAFFLIRLLKLPSQNKEEIQRMLAFVLTKKVVYPLEEIIYDFSLVDAQEGYSKVLVFIIPRKKVEELVPAVGKNPRRLIFTITSAGVVNWLAHQKKIFKEEIEYPLIVVDVDKDQGEFLAVDKEDILFSRAFNLGDEEDIREGISQSLKIFRNEFPQVSFRKIIFTGVKKEGGLSRYEGIDAGFIGDKDNFSFGPKVKEKRADVSFAAILGLAGADAPKFDFSPPVLKRKRETIRKRQRYLDIVAVVVEIILIGSILIGNYVWGRYCWQQYLKAELEKVEGPLKELAVIEDKLGVFNREFSQRRLFGEILHSLVLSLPPNVRLTLADFKEDGDFSLKGYAADDAQVFAAKTALYNTGAFSEVKVKYASTVKQKGAPMVEFYIYGKRKFLKEQ